MCYNTVTMNKYSKEFSVMLEYGIKLNLGVLYNAMNKLFKIPRVINLLKDGGAQLTHKGTYGGYRRININNTIFNELHLIMIRLSLNSGAVLNDDVRITKRMLNSISNTGGYYYNNRYYHASNNLPYLFTELITHAFTVLNYLCTRSTVIIIALYLIHINIHNTELLNELRSTDGYVSVINNK